MATDPQTLFNEAKCYECFASNPYTLNLLKLALLQQIAQNGGGGGGGCSVFTCLADVPASYAGAGGKEVFVNAAATGLEFVGPYFTKVGTAYIGGDQTGNARGANAIDIQSGRNAATKVASGSKSVAFGFGCTASGGYASAFGYQSVASSDLTFAAGLSCTASGTYSTCFGNAATASGYASNAFGYNAEARVDYTTNICGPLINRRDGGETVDVSFYKHCGVEVVLLTPVIDFESVADYVIPLPSGCHFYPDECGVIVTSATLVTVQPTVRFGNSGTPAKFLAATITTTAAAQFNRQRFQTLLSAAGEVTLSAGVTIAATATTMLGRFYMKGLLVEDQ